MRASPSRTTSWVDSLTASAARVRLRVLAQVVAAGGGHLSQACSSAELLTMLLRRLAHLDPPAAPLVPSTAHALPGTAWLPGRDAVVLGPAGYELAVLAALVEIGRLADQALTMDLSPTPGFTTTSDVLGAAVALAVERQATVPGRVWAMIDDQTCTTGAAWEAFAAAGHHRCRRLTVLIDANGRGPTGWLAATHTIEPLVARLRAFGCAASEVDGHDLRALDRVCRQAHADRPLVVIARTDPCRGCEVMRPLAPHLGRIALSTDALRQAFLTALRHPVTSG